MLADQITADIKAAMLARDAAALTTLRGLKSAMGYYAIEKKTDQLSDEDVQAVARKQIKQRQDAAAMYDEGGDAERAAAERAEIEIIKAYLPAEADDDTIREVVARVLQEQGITEKKQMGLAIKTVVAELKGAADGRRVSQIVGELLAQ